MAAEERPCKNKPENSHECRQQLGIVAIPPFLQNAPHFISWDIFWRWNYEVSCKNSNMILFLKNIQSYGLVCPHGQQVNNTRLGLDQSYDNHVTGGTSVTTYLISDSSCKLWPYSPARSPLTHDTGITWLLLSDQIEKVLLWRGCEATGHGRHRVLTQS